MRKETAFDPYIVRLDDIGVGSGRPSLSRMVGKGLAQ